MTFGRIAKRHDLFIRLISLILLPTFLLSNIAFASPNDNTARTTKSDEVITDPEKIVIPKEYGIIKAKYAGNSGRFIIHIQDAHCNFEAQSNIAKILENLIKNDNIKFVSVEGADGIIDTSWFKAFPDEEVRKEVATYFMKKGEITGPEFLSITTDLPVTLFGAETRSYYIDNLNAFTSSYPLKEDTERYFNQIKNVLNRLKSYIYNEDLKLMDVKMQDYESKKIQFNEYVRFLQSEAEKYRINLREYYDFFKLVSALIYEKKIDFNVTDKERNTLIDELSKILSKEALTELVSESLSFKVGKISSAEYYNYLKTLAINNNIDLIKRFPNLYNYIIYNSVYSKIDNEKLFNDIKKLEMAIKEKLFANDDQRTLEKLSRHIEILLGLVNIKLLNGDFDYYKAHKDEFTHEAFTGFIKKKTVQYGLAYDVEPPTEAVAESIPKLEEFYAIATKRDNALVDNTLKQMKKEKLVAGILITGGFHSEGITKILEKQGVSYMVVCPSITKDVPSPYIQILTNQRTPLEDILVGGAEATKQGMLAPILRSQILSLNEAGLKRLSQEIREGQELVAYAQEMKRSWVAIYINGVEIGQIRVLGYVKNKMRQAGGSELNVGDLIRNDFIEQLKARCDSLGMSGNKRDAIVGDVQRQLATTEVASILDRFEKEFNDRLRERTRRQLYHPNGSYFTIDDINLTGKTVGARVDLNVKKAELSDKNISDGKIHNRIKEAAKTLIELSDKGAKVVVLAHQGRPGEEDYMPTLERHAMAIAKAMEMQGRPDVAAKVRAVLGTEKLYDDNVKNAIQSLAPGQILVLNNARPEEKEKDKITELEKLFNVYVIDGFSVAHRDSPSVTGFTNKPNVAGRLMQSEIDGLNRAVKNINKPYVMSLGGLKIDDYTGIIEKALKEDLAGNIITGGALAQLLLTARGYDLGEANRRFLEKKFAHSKKEKGEIKYDFAELIAMLKDLDAKYPGRFVAPIDFVVGNVVVGEDGRIIDIKDVQTVSLQGLAKVNLPIYDIGEETRKDYIKVVKSAKTVYIKGPLGAFDVAVEGKPSPFLGGTKAVFDVVTKQTKDGKTFSFGGGGDTDKALKATGAKLSHQTLAGGAALEFLEGKKLPGVARLEESAYDGMPWNFATRTPGTGAVRGSDFKDPLGLDEAGAIGRAIKATIEANKAREVFEERTNGVFVVLDDATYENAAREYGAPLDIECHPGTRGTRIHYDPSRPETYNTRVKRRYYIRESLFNKLDIEERLVFAMHEELHIKIALGIVKISKGINEEAFINSQPGCDVRPIMASFGSISHMEDILIADISYGDAAQVYIAKARKEIASFVDRKDLEKAEKKEAELNRFISITYARRNNIDRMKSVLTEEPYRGYDVIIISSTTPDEAEYQKRILESAFQKVRTGNRLLNNKVCILSVIDESEGGQIIGQVNTWVKAVDEFRAWAKTNNIAARDSDLDYLFKQGKVKIAVYHNGGKGERASPATQSLGNSRGAQKLVGQVFGTEGKQIDLELILAVVLETSPMATTNDASRIDTFWTNQLAFGSVDFSRLERSNFAFDKFIIKIPAQPRMKDLYDYGTAIIAESGKILKFLAGKRLTKKDPKTGEYIPNPEYSAQLKELLSASKGVFDYGPFSMNRDLHYAMLDYWKNIKNIFTVMARNNGRANISRDIEPAFVQIIVPLVNGLKDRELPKNLPDEKVLKGLDDYAAKEALLDEVYHSLTNIMPEEYREALAIIYKRDKQPVLETIELFLLHRDSIFRNLDAVVGNVDLGENSHWFAYKRLLDMANEKFIMLADINEGTLEIDANGETLVSPASLEDRIKAEDARRMRRIKNKEVAVFVVDGERVVLSAEDMRKGWEDKKRGIIVKGSIIQGNSVLMPGSVVINSVINDSQGMIKAENSYVESVTCTRLEAKNSIIYKAIETGTLKTDKEIVADAYRPAINDARFPSAQKGQTRMRAPIGYDPKPTDKTLAQSMSDKVRFGDNEYSFEEIREMPCNRAKNDRIENKIRITTLTVNGMRESLRRHLSLLSEMGQLAPELVENIIKDLNQGRPDSQTRTEMVFLCNILNDYGNDEVKTLALKEKEDLLKNNLGLGITIEPNLYKRDSVRGVGRELTEEIAKAAGAAYVMTLATMRHKEPADIVIAVGRDSRPSGEMIRAGLTEGAMLAGATVIDVTNGGSEINSTPIMYFASRYLENGKLDGVIEITASHLKYEPATGEDNNGLKPTVGPVNFSTKEMKQWLMATHDIINNGLPASKGVSRKESIVEPYRILCAAALEGSEEWLSLAEKVWAGKISLRNAIDSIRPRAESYLKTRPLAGKLSIVADSGFGSMGPIIGPLATATGAGFRDIGDEPDLSKAKHDANPNNPDNLPMLIEEVKTSAADLGMAFDADGDRLAVVTKKGNVLRGDDIACMIAPVVIREAIVKAEAEGVKDYRPVIVMNLLCSERLKRAILDAGGIPVECGVGFNNVKEAMTTRLQEFYSTQYPGKNELKEGQTAEMGVEISSHIMFRENFNADDAFFAVMKMIKVLRQELDRREGSGEALPESLIDDMLSRLDKKLGITDNHTGEWRTPIISNEARVEVANRLKEHYLKMAEERPDRYKVRNTLDGIKIDFNEDGSAWLAIRPSGTAAEIVIAINSLSGIDDFNMIKNDLLEQLGNFKDFIKWQQKNSKGEMEPALQPLIYYREAHGYIFEGKALPVKTEDISGSRTPGTGAVRTGAAIGLDSIVERSFITDNIVTGIYYGEGLTRSAVEGLFVNLTEDEYISMLEKISNEILENYEKRVPAAERQKFLNNYEAFFKGVARWAVILKNAELAKNLQIMAGQGLNIVAWIRFGLAGADKIRLTANPEFMLKSPDKYRGLSFLDARTLPVEQAAGEGKSGAYWRGAEGTSKLGKNIAGSAIYNSGQFISGQNNVVMYEMVHGVNGALAHETAFLHNTLPGSIQCTSTGPGHFQGLSLDIKYVTEGRGIQYNKFYNEKGELVKVVAQLLEPGTWAVALPGAVDSVENLGNLRFNDFSVSVTEEETAALLNPMGLDIKKLLANKDGIDTGSKAVPYYTVMVKGEPHLIRSGSVTTDIEWVKTAPSALFGNKTFTEFYNGGMTESAMDGIIENSLKTIYPKNLTTKASVKPMDAVDMLKYAKILSIIQSSQPIISVPAEGVHDTYVTKPYAWGGRGIAKALGWKSQDIAEIWFNSTQDDGLSRVPGTELDITLKEVIEANPEAMLGAGMAAKPVFSKFLGKDASQPQILHMGFNENIEGNEERFKNLVKQERALVVELKDSLVAAELTQEEFDAYRAAYEKWVSDEMRARWASRELPELPKAMSGFDRAIFEKIRIIRQDMVSFLNEIELKPGQIVLGPVGYIHSIVGSHQTHPLADNPQAKNEAWYVFSAGKDATGKDMLLYFEPQQTSNTTYSPFDFPTPIVWGKEGKPVMRKDLTAKLDAILKPGEAKPATDSAAIDLILKRTVHFKATNPEEFILTNRTGFPTAGYSTPLRAYVESLISGTYSVWPNDLFTLHRIALEGKGKGKEGAVAINPSKTFYELTVTKGEVEIKIGDTWQKLTSGTSVFIPASYNKSVPIKSNGRAEVLRLIPAQAGIAKTTRIEAARTAQEASVKDSPEVINMMIEKEKSELESTLKNSMQKADIKDGVVIVALDDDLYKGYANQAITELPTMIERNASPGAVVTVRGKGNELAANIAAATQKIEAEGLKVRNIVTQLNSNTWSGAKDELARLGTVLSVDLQGKTLDDHYIQVLRLFDLSIKIAYEFKPEDIGSTLSRITGKSVSIEDVMNMLAQKILEILPEMRPIDTSTAVEAYKAVRAALISL